MTEINVTIEQIESERRYKCMIYKYISRTGTVLITITSILTMLNSQLSFVTPSWKLSIVSAFAVILDLAIEYLIRSKFHLIEGPSVYLIELKRHHDRLKKIIENCYVNNPGQLHPSTQTEVEEIQKAIDNLINDLTFSKSLSTVLCKNNINYPNS